MVNVICKHVPLSLSCTQSGCEESTRAQSAIEQAASAFLTKSWKFQGETRNLSERSLGKTAKSLIRFVLRNKKKLIFFFNNPINSISSTTFAKDQDIREQILISVAFSTMLAKSNF